ncbi:hypothetical protein H1S01_03480 [Heliobacterium chlorum]|uniref:ATP-binding protein n=1 Tax=Heliobacterium chlorum TaxID=2698 RepID=A0ABR7SYG6_HELCL|nr:hypothetical protein [Heliobacterium chlorum]MBC9783574.1 hypothetical protein [Heliobacterium chlorum]
MWETVLEHGTVKYFLSCPNLWAEMIKQKISATWPRAAVVQSDVPVFDSKNSTGATLGLKHHYFMSMKTDKRQTRAHLDSLIEVTRDLSKNEKAMLQVVIMPESDDWRDSAAEAYQQFKKDVLKKRLRFNLNNALVSLGEILDGGLESISGFCAALSGEGISTNEDGVPSRASLLRDGGLSESTMHKTRYKGFDVTTRLVVESQDWEKREILLKSAITAMNDLNADNEWHVSVEGVSDKFIRKVHRREVDAKFEGDIFSVPELAKLVNLPLKSTQEAFPEVVQQEKTEVDPPPTISKGIPIGDITWKGSIITVCWPTHDYDALCKPRLVLGEQGCGKSKGFGAGFCADSLRQGFSVFVAETADGEFGDMCRDTVPEGFPPDHIIDLDFNRVDWPIALSMFGPMKFEDGTVDGKIAAARFTDYLISFLGKLHGEEMSPRMNRYLGAAAKLTLSHQGAGISDVIKTLTDDKVRKATIQRGGHWKAVADLKDLDKMKPDARDNLLRPIMDRLSMLLANDFIANILLQPEAKEMSFRRWMDGDERGPYLVIFRADKEVLGEEGLDLLMTAINGRWFLELLGRRNIKEEERTPCFFIQDEPHKFLGSATGGGTSIWGQMVRESRKYRGGLIWLGHNFEDFGSFVETMKAAGLQLVLYKTKPSVYQQLKSELRPLTPEDCDKTPDVHWAVVAMKAPKDTEQIPTMMVRMAPPPDKRYGQREMGYRVEECLKEYGRSFEEAEKLIQGETEKFA